MAGHARWRCRQSANETRGRLRLETHRVPYCLGIASSLLEFCRSQLLTAVGEDLSRRALEALVLEEYRRGRLTRPEAGRLLGFETRAELDTFFAAREAFGTYTAAALEQDLRCRFGVRTQVMLAIESRHRAC